MAYVRLALVRDLGLLHGTNDVQRFLDDVQVAKKLEYDSVSEKEWKGSVRYKYVQKRRRQAFKKAKKKGG